MTEINQLKAEPPVLLVDYPSATGEGPLWNEQEQALYWVDIPTGQLFRYTPASGTNELIYRDTEAIGGYTFQTDGSVLLFGARGKILCWNSGTVTTVVESLPGEEDSRFNDVHAAPDGSVLCGTMPSSNHLASLYRLAPDGSVTRIYDDIGLSNGFGFSPDRKTLYYTDSNNRLIFAIDYDNSAGALSNRRVIVRTPENAGVPDGMTVDAQGNIWSARWDGHGLFKYSPTGELLGKVSFPVRKVSSIAFGGSDFRTAFVTTAGGTSRGEVEGELAGSLFSINLGVAGMAPFRSRVCV